MEIELESLSKPLKQSEQLRNSYEEVTCFSSFFFTWILTAYRKSLLATLQPQDLLQIAKSEGVEENRLEYRTTLLKTLFGKYTWQLIGGMLLCLCSGIIEYAIPVYLMYLETFLASDKTIWEGLTSVAVLCAVLILKMLFWRSTIWLEKRLHLRIRTGLISLVYSNILTSPTSVATSEVVNELEVDIERVADGSSYFFWITSCTTELLMSLFVLVPAIGPASYIGLGLLVLVMVLNLIAAGHGNDLYDRIMELKDERMKFSMELFANMKVLKMAVWENALLKRVKDVRKKEAGILSRFMLIWSGMQFSLWSTPILATITTFSASNILFGETMTVEAAFTTISVFYILQGPLLWMPGSVTWLWSSVSSSKRIDKFLHKEKIADERVKDIGDKGSIQFTNASFSYSESADSILTDIDLTITPGEFIAIVGKVGSGKSSLVNAVLGEMKGKSGTLAVNGTLAYTAALESWIQNASVRDNILFGKAYEPDKYNSTIQASALLSDLELLPGGDKTEIGEKGINLSGGQKARVSLARAVYQDSDIYLLDDPLSSVDAHVGSHIFHNCFLGALKGKTRILITHNTNFLSLVDRVVVMENGKIADITDYTHLRTDIVSSSDEPAPPLLLSKHDSSELIEDEDRQSGKVDFSVYRTYMRYSGGTSIFLICLLSLLLWLFARFLGDLSIKHWTEYPEEGDSYFHLYLIFASITSVCLLLQAVILSISGVKAGTRIHVDMLNRLVRAPINLFYDVTPLGRILNRLAKDQQTIDMEISYNIGSVMTSIGSGIATITACVYFLPWVVLAVPIVLFFAIYLQQVFLQLTRETTRMEHIARSPMVQQFTESVAGLKTLRCFSKQSQFTEKMNRLVETSGRVTFTNKAAETWLMMWMELFAMGFTCIVVCYLVIGREEPAVAALVLTYLIPLSEAVSDGVDELASLERYMISVERAHALTQVAQEDETLSDTPHWPTEGNIQLIGISLKYRPSTPQVLKDVSASIHAKERVGIAGRTGSGKSSLTLALFRIVELQRGHILIDGVDIQAIGLHTLRRAMTMIPQDPVLFQGSLRYNLDPCELHTEEEVRAVMKDVGLELDFEKEVSEGGTNFSVGERQLMCIARAGLAHPKILVLDEATSAIDHRTDTLIQEYVRAKFDCTVLTIAHRLHTILDSDRVMVLDQGRLVEFDTPHSLLADKTSAFYQLAQSLGYEAK